MAWFVALTIGSAWAGAPAATVSDDGTVVVVATVEAPEAAVRTALADDQVVAGLFPEVLGETFAADGSCRTVERQTKGLWRPLVVLARRCPTSSGWREDLVRPGDFASYRVEWVVAPEASGDTRIEYRVRTELALAVPQTTVNEAVRRSAVSAMGRLVRRLVPGG